jgi:hypothetical protein
MHEFGLVNDFLARKWLTLRHSLAIFHTIEHEQERATNSGKTRSAHWLHLSARRRGTIGKTISHYKLHFFHGIIEVK